MKKIVLLYKRISETPLEALQRFKFEKPEYKDAKMAYAGRLDPMAHGLLLVLINDECKNRSHYQNLKKEYIFQFFLGVQTDTYDVMGKITENKNIKLPNINSSIITKTLNQFIGKRQQEFPPYSSKRINGIPMFKLARDGILDKYEIPTKEVTTYSIDLINTNIIDLSNSQFIKTLTKRIANVHGDFRQASIINEWQQWFKKHDQEKLVLYTCKINAGSGTYVRSIVHDLGQMIGTGAVTFEIYRSSVGNYKLPIYI